MAELFLQAAGARCDLFTSMLCCSWLDQQHPAFLPRDRIVADAAGYGQEVALLEIDGFVLKLNSKRSFDDIKELVLPLVRVPHEFALEFCDLEKLIVDLADHLGRPVFRHPVECGGKRCWR